MADLNNLLAELERSPEDDILAQSDIDEEAAAVAGPGPGGEVQDVDAGTTGSTDINRGDRVYEGVPEVLRLAAQEGMNAHTALVNDDGDIDGDPQENDDMSSERSNDKILLTKKELGLNVDAQQDEDYARLKAAWIRERLCPELLPYDQETISLELELIEGQEDTIDAFTSTSNVDALINQIYRLDVERTKFVVSDLLTTRLNKLESHALYNRTLVDRMSDQEVSCRVSTDHELMVLQQQANSRYLVMCNSLFTCFVSPSHILKSMPARLHI